jgi:hypothetical protein
MELTFALRNGTRAGVMPRQDARDVVVERRCVERSAAAEDVAVVFHVSNKAALDRILERFGGEDC